jgi:hypothetical protein
VFSTPEKKQDPEEGDLLAQHGSKNSNTSNPDF